MPRLTRKQNYIALTIVMVNSFTNPRIKPFKFNYFAPSSNEKCILCCFVSKQPRQYETLQPQQC